MVLIIIIFLSSFFVPFIILYPIQEVLYRPNNIWFLEASLSTYITFCVAMISLSVIMLVNLLVQPTSKRRKLFQRVLYTLFLFVTVGVMVLCINNYHYLNEKGIYKNQFFSLSEDLTGWEEIIKAEQVYTQKRKVTEEDRFIFTLKDGSIIELPVTAKLRNNKSFIRERLNNNNVMIENVYPTIGQ